MLASLTEAYEVFWVTEKTDFFCEADYYLLQTGLKDRYFLWKMLANCLKTIVIWLKERPDCVISTGAMVVIPMLLLAKLCGKKVIFIETFARIYDGTKTGRFVYRFADLFIVQWESLLEVYPDAVYGGSIY